MNLDNIKKTRLIIPAVFFFSLVRSVIFATEDLTGFNLYNKELTFDLYCALFWILIFLNAFLTAMLVFTVHKKLGNKFWLPCLFLIADPVFLINQRHIPVLFVHVLWLIYMNNQYFNKVIIRYLSQILFLIPATIISPEATLGFLPLVFLTEIIPVLNNTKKRKNTVPALFSAISAVVIGFVSNRVLSANIPEFNTFIDFINPAQFIEKDKITGVLLLSIPVLILGIYFFYILFKNYYIISKSNKKEFIRTNKTEQLLIIITATCFFLFVGCIFGGYKTLSAISLFVPIIILLLSFTEDPTVEVSLSEIDNLIHKHLSASILIFISISYICIRFYLRYFGASIMANFFI